MAAFIKALLFVVVGEMGDKTQLLAMAMASKYKVGQVMIGVLVATILNHALAVLVGSYLSSMIPMNVVAMVAGASFLIFGLWTIRGDTNDDSKNKISKFGPIVTVGIAFFLAEMGDKTQLMTIAIAAEYQQPLTVLMGTTTGMLIADGIGVLCGAWLCKHVQDIYIKWFAGIVFIFFGTLTLKNSLPAWVVNPVNVSLYFLVVIALVYLIGVKLANRNRPTPCESIMAADGITDPAMPAQVVSSIPAATAISNKR
jgi:putative Ca2+/H+ antiporter (TMEM165/GDT1 family)